MVAKKEKKAKKGKEPKPKKLSKEERKAEKQAKKKQGGGFLIGLLTVLLVLVGVCELGLLSFIGITAFRSSISGPQTVTIEPGETGVSAFYIQYSGPGRRVVDGVLVEGRELDQNIVQNPAGSTPANPSAT